MASLYDKYYERQPGPVKIIVVAGLALVGYKVYTAWKHDQDEKDANKAADAAALELNQLQQQGEYPSYQPSQYENFSQAIVTAIDGCGTDEDTIYSVFAQMRNRADVLQLIKTFAVRYTQPCSASQPISYALWLVNDKAFGGPLDVFLRYDLSDSEMQNINSILRGNGINYQF